MLLLRPLMKLVKTACLVAGTLFFALLGPAFATEDEGLLPFAVLEDKWVTPDGFFGGAIVAPSEEVEGPASLASSVPVLSPPLMPSTWDWKNVQEIQTEEAKIDFFDDASHWKKLEDVKDNLDRFYETTLAQGNDGQASSKIRFSLLPNGDVKSAHDVRISKPKMEAEAAAAKVEKLSPQKKAELKKAGEACEALSKAKKKQLEAIESDRRTLNALRDAMKDLGLDKKLAFMTDGAQSVPVEQESAKLEAALPPSQIP